MFLLYSNSKELYSAKPVAINDIFTNFLNEKEKEPESYKAIKACVNSEKNFQRRSIFPLEKTASPSQIPALQENIIQRIKPKSFSGKQMKGPMVYKFAYELVEFLKKNTAVNVPEILEQIFSSEAKEILEDVKKDFSLKVLRGILSFIYI